MSIGNGGVLNNTELSNSCKDIISFCSELVKYTEYQLGERYYRLSGQDIIRLYPFDMGYDSPKQYKNDPSEFHFTIWRLITETKKTFFKKSSTILQDCVLMDVYGVYTNLPSIRPEHIKINNICLDWQQAYLLTDFRKLYSEALCIAKEYKEDWEVYKKERDSKHQGDMKLGADIACELLKL